LGFYHSRLKAGGEGGGRTTPAEGPQGKKEKRRKKCISRSSSLDRWGGGQGSTPRRWWGKKKKEEGGKSPPLHCSTVHFPECEGEEERGGVGSFTLLVPMTRKREEGKIRGGSGEGEMEADVSITIHIYLSLPPLMTQRKKRKSLKGPAPATLAMTRGKSGAVFVPLASFSHFRVLEIVRTEEKKSGKTCRSLSGAQLEKGKKRRGGGKEGGQGKIAGSRCFFCSSLSDRGSGRKKERGD